MAFVACSDDDDDDAVVEEVEEEEEEEEEEEVVLTASEVIAGTYSCDLVVSISGEEVSNETKDLVLTANGEDMVDCKIPDLTLSVSGLEVSLGDLEITECTITVDEDDESLYYVEGYVLFEDMTVPISGVSLLVDCEVILDDCTVTEDGELYFPIVVNVDLSPSGLSTTLPVDVVLSGTKAEEEEE